MRVLRGGGVVRSYPIPTGHEARALVTAGRVAVVTQPKQGWDGFQLRVDDAATGQPVVRRTQAGRAERLYVVGDTLFVEYASAVAQIATRTLTQNLRVTGRAGTIDGWRVAENTRSLLFDSPNGAYSPYEPVRLNYFRFDLATGQVVSLAFAVPARPGCGLPEKDGTRGEVETYTAREIVATRHDRCGVFEARFDWVVGPSSRPVIRPRN
ncbi:hypothetical protein [Deinococcus sp. NW-56]|uniref:hypothetical protein n=1 Tax=Deinococcus sp. NW-56 TaxID=2080419 RepID=UPI001319D8D0|nr:hypothetical protein [Deinococcus sp. NW-56]